jgi:hypothetical protein
MKSIASIGTAGSSNGTTETPSERMTPNAASVFRRISSALRLRPLSRR